MTGVQTCALPISDDRWYGVTYKEDKETVVNAIKALKDKGVYPVNLWEEK